MAEYGFTKTSGSVTGVSTKNWPIADRRVPRTDPRNNRPFYQYGGHIELIRFKEYYRMPRGHEQISFVFRALFGTFFRKVFLE